MCLPTSELLCKFKQQHKGVSVTFDPEYAKPKVPEGTVFKIEFKGKLYYLYSVEEKKIINAVKEIKCELYCR